MHGVHASETQMKHEIETMVKSVESIHSGQFMVSTFEAEEQDDEDEVAVPIPEVPEANTTVVPVKQFSYQDVKNQQQLSIDTSLSKLFQCMTLAYRQKLTSPKWNRFRGIRLRWKDKIRLNNVIWRCWHLQFVQKQKTLICQFASPLDVDTHNKPEAVVLEGKYWKRKLAAVTAEYKRWRLFHRNYVLGQTTKDDVEMFHDVDLLTWDSQSSENMHMLVDEDYMGLMSDTLFSTIVNQNFVFPDSREIAKAGLAEFIQPSLGPLQPNLDDNMDTLDPFQAFLTCKLPPVLEEQNGNVWNYSDLDMMASNANIQMNTISSSSQTVDQYQENVALSQIRPGKSSQINQSLNEQNIYNAVMQQPVNQYTSQPPASPPSPYHLSVIPKANKSSKNVRPSQNHNQYAKTLNILYNNYPEQNMGVSVKSCTSSVPVQKHLLEQVSSPEQIVSIPPDRQKLQQKYKMLQQSCDQGQFTNYEFTSPAAPSLKFTSQVSPVTHPISSSDFHHATNLSFSKEEKIETRTSGSRGRHIRSRSSTREPIRHQQLSPAVSDPSLLTQLLTSNTDREHMFKKRPSLRTAHDQLPKQVQVKEEGISMPMMSHQQPVSSSPSLIITNSINSAANACNSDPLMLNSYSTADSPIQDNLPSVNSPASSQSSLGSPNRDNSLRDPRRAGHIHAEQKRRYNIKNGFDMIHSLIPHLNQNPNAKLSKAAMLQKGAEYIRQLRSERNQLNEEMKNLKQQIEALNTSISNCQSMLPATGAPVSRRRDSKMQEMFDDYIKKRTMENWKYWIFSLLFRPLLESFNNFVSTSSLEDLYRSTILWIEQHCTLVDLRPVVLNSLKYLSTKTDILSEPQKLPDEVRHIVFSKNLN